MKKYIRRNPVIEATQHDGSDNSAIRIEAWVNSCIPGGSTAFVKGSVDYAQNSAFIRLNTSDRPQNLVGPSWWVIRADSKHFYAVPDKDFQLLYLPDPIEEDSTHA